MTKPWMMLLLSLSLFSPSCGRSKGGGIVDNGNHVPNPHKNDPASSGLIPTDLEIFERFIISVPGINWRTEVKLTENRETTVSRDNDLIVFALDTVTGCEGEGTETGNGVLLFECSENETVILMPDSTRIVATYRARTEVIQNILRSIRMR
jgi:hypothetical protein